MEIVEAYFRLEHTSTLKKVEAFLFGNCHVALKFH